MSSTSLDPDGPIVAYAWDLDGDGAFDDGSGIAATIALGTGLHRVGLRVVDRDGAVASVYRPILIAPELLQPVPGGAPQRGQHARGRARAAAGRACRTGCPGDLHCRGRGCPWRRRSVLSEDGAVRFRRLQRRLRAGTVIEIFAGRPARSASTRASGSGAAARPARVDSCFVAGARASCPSR